jgi:hypothetical protein
MVNLQQGEATGEQVLVAVAVAGNMERTVPAELL